MMSFRSACPSGWCILSLCLLVSLFNIADAQNCKTVSPCTDPDSVARFAAYSNASLFTDAMEECGQSLDAISAAIVGPCFDELVVRPGCDCGTRACKAAIQPLVAQTCKRAILGVVCDAADWLEPQLLANVRSMYLHVLNDCALGSKEGCNADNFDDSLCAGLPTSAPAPAPAPAPVVFLGPRCSEDLTALFNSGPALAPSAIPAEVPVLVPELVPEAAAVSPVADLPAPLDTEPTMPSVAAPLVEPDEPVEADTPAQQARDATGDVPEVPASDPEAAAAAHLSSAVLSAVIVALAGVVWGA